MKTILTCVVGLLLTVWQFALHAETIEAIRPRTCKPGQATSLVLHGKELGDGLRVAVLAPDVTLRIEKIEPTQAAIELTIPADQPPGPLNLWLAKKNGDVEAHTLLVDDLELVTDNANNHTQETAQAIPTLATIEGICDASASDFYRFHVTSGERVAFEVLTQDLHSTMDPVCRLLDASGKTMLQADDTQVGPDLRFSFQFPGEGDYWLEIHDNRNSAGGSHYQLRVGDFPVVSQSFPLAVQAGQNVSVSFLGADADLLEPQVVKVPTGSPKQTNVRARLKDGKSSTWAPVILSNNPQVIESASTEPLTPPIGVSGRLQNPKEVDSYTVRGVKGQAIRITSRTRSLGSPALLQMQLFSSTGTKIAETKVSDSDEWSMDATFPEDGDYRLDVSDLLKRGGTEFGYWISISPAGTFSVSLKGDAKTPEQFKVELTKGAFALDLSVARFGFDGEIELSLANTDRGIRLLNPRIPAKAETARVYLTADKDWRLDQFEVFKIVATAVNNPENYCLIDSHAIDRLKEPFVLSPNTEMDGAIVLAAVPPTDSPFAMEPAAPLEFARPLRAHTAVVNLKRIQAEFKSAVEVLTNALPQGWVGEAKADTDAYTLTLNQNDQAIETPEHLSLLIYGEFQGAGRLETLDVPIRWIDPVSIQLEFAAPIVRGGVAHGRASLTRAGNDPQPITVTFANLPTGITGPASIAFTAEQASAEFDLQIASDAALETVHSLTLNAASKFRGQDFSAASVHELPLLVDSPQKLGVYPSAIELQDPRGRQQMVVTGTDQHHASRDWTQYAKYVSLRPDIAEVRAGVVYPIADGETEIRVEVGGTRQNIPVRVSQMGTPRPIEFESEVLVALSKQGCNSGACHGSPSGKGGFRLSLRAFDMQLDQLTLIHEDFGRRVNWIEPEKSLLLLKPLMKVAHGGGKQLRQEDAAYAILKEWIAGGAAVDQPNMPRVVRLEVTPAEKQIRSLADGGQQLAVTAHFSDGRTRDVTHLVAYESSNTSVASVDANGLVSPHARGEVAVLVRFLEHIESAPLMFVEQRKNFQWASPPPNNYIDELVNAKLQQLQYLPAETCTDSEFLRRVYLDVLGVLPTVGESTAFLADTAEDKRARLIDALLEREEYAKFWALKWGDLLKMTRKQVGDEGVYKYHRWVEDALKNNMPYDEFASQLILGSGSTFANPPANFYRTSSDMNECVETISQVFLGARLQCAKCHNHPFERWTQDNYYGLGAFFNRVQQRKTDRPGEMFIYTNFSGEVTQPRTGKAMSPWLPQVGSIDRAEDVDQRIAFSQWLVQPDNPYLARIEANRIWSQLFSRGIVDPVDDFRDSNPPSNAPLLDALTKEFVESGFDRKQLLRSILSSRTYQASHVTNELNQEDTIYFSHQIPRLLAGEQLLDALNRSLDLQQTFGTLPVGTLATQLPAPDLVKVDFLKVFGQPERSTVCACERSDDSNLGMALELFNGPVIHGKLRDESNRFRKDLAAGKTVEQVVTDIYLAAVCRPPSEIELKAAIDHCSKASEAVVGIEDVCWALFNTDEFLFQH